MGTISLYILFSSFDYKFYNVKLSDFGFICCLIARWFYFFIYIILFGCLALLENIFIFPIWCFYNLFHKKQFRRSYIDFLQLDKLLDKLLG